jgi:ADP-heptose:LPS heptosyltransferase
LKESLAADDLSLPVYEADSNRIISLRSSLNLSETDSLIIICPDVGGNLHVRNYPLESYAQVARHLLDDKGDRYIAIIGVESNESICAELAERIGGQRVVNLCGKTGSLQELMDLISTSELLIGNDNGPLHFASLTRVPILGIFSTDTPFMYGPLGNAVALYTFFHCSPCISAYNHKSSACTDGACIKAISPHAVFEAAKRMLSGQVPYRTINGVMPYILAECGPESCASEPPVRGIGRASKGTQQSARALA